MLYAMSNMKHQWIMYLSENVRNDSKNTGGKQNTRKMEASPQDSAQMDQGERKVRENK